ncbi:TetR/AcrR family transcriptional regulator [Chitinophaga ginsengisoli]|uniref:TetR family transcriptional regulator n=1 Tax=Chitinophaga ginsengisoli TaxID=363837 RepID=A0A2P8GLE0_9BACT|nr:TetR/AcrR family transcriptional regulator [Chitinophaga ginsengisoli]PSL34782.1 TetR family transcriptional regulator [Chitinophaga ginsengisoli]
MSKAEKTKEFIVEKTAPIFNKKGFAGTSLSDMTEATGLTKGSIYGNFANKDEVALASFDYNLRKMRSFIYAEEEKVETIKEKLMVRTRLFGKERPLAYPEGGCPLLNTGPEADDTHPALRARVADAIERWKERTISMIEEGIRNKEISPDTDAEQAALTLISMIQGAIFVARTTGKLEYGKRVMESTRKYIESL